MTDQQLTAEVAKLEHYLFDVWRWVELFGIAEEQQGLNLSLEPYEPGYREDERAILQRLNTLLSACYNDAVAEVDNALSNIPEGDIRDVLLNGLLDRLRDLQRPGACWKQWTEREAHRYAEQRDAEWHEALPTPADAWADIEGYVHQYVSALVAHIEGRIAEVQQDAPQAINRPKWSGSASELAYLLTELIEADHLVPPPRGRKRGREGNRAAIAEAMYRAFDIRDKDTNEPVTLNYFKSLMRPDSPDRGTHRHLFAISHRSGAK
jgi:hypothetical protein